MTDASLYSLGWRQGSVFSLELAVAVSRWSDEGLRTDTATHGLWMIATQDCNLWRAKPSSNTPSIELRQVLVADPPTVWGIHARKFRLNDSGGYLVDDKPVAFVSPRVVANVPREAVRGGVDGRRVAALKTWLGNRYDRPAVPDGLVSLAKAIARSIEGHTTAVENATVRDVYMQFESDRDVPRYSLYAVVEEGVDLASVREWLASASFSVPQHLGLLDQIEVVTAREASLYLIETSYCADLSQITWSAGPEASGAP